LSALRGDLHVNCLMLEPLKNATKISRLSLAFGPTSLNCSAQSLSAAVASWGALTNLSLDFSHGKITSDALLGLVQALAHSPTAKMKSFGLRVAAHPSWSTEMTAAFTTFLESHQPIRSLDLMWPGNSSDPTVGAKILPLLGHPWKNLQLDMQALYSDKSIPHWDDVFGKMRVSAASTTTGNFGWYLKYLSKDNFQTFVDKLYAVFKRVDVIRQHQNIFLGPAANKDPSQLESLAGLYGKSADLHLVFASTPPLGAEISSAFYKSFGTCSDNPSAAGRRIRITLPHATDGLNTMRELCLALRQCNDLTAVYLDVAHLLDSTPRARWGTDLSACRRLAAAVDTLQMSVSPEAKDFFSIHKSWKGVTWKVVDVH